VWKRQIHQHQPWGLSLYSSAPRWHQAQIRPTEQQLAECTLDFQLLSEDNPELDVTGDSLP
jgi:hypothetical protein